MIWHTGILTLLAPVVALSISAGQTSQGVATGSGTELRSYPLPNHGMLKLKVPVDWNEKISNPEGDLPPTITFSSLAEASFKVLVTPMWSKFPNPGFLCQDSVKRMVVDTGRKALQSAQETSVTLRKVTLGSNFGYYYALTDRAPQSDGFAFMTQGAGATGELLLSMTVLTRDKDAPEVEAAIRMVTEAIDEPPPDGQPAQGSGLGLRDGQIVATEFPYSFKIPQGWVLKGSSVQSATAVYDPRTGASFAISAERLEADPEAVLKVRRIERAFLGGSYRLVEETTRKVGGRPGTEAAYTRHYDGIEPLFFREVLVPVLGNLYTLQWQVSEARAKELQPVFEALLKTVSFNRIKLP